MKIKEMKEKRLCAYKHCSYYNECLLKDENEKCRVYKKSNIWMKLFLLGMI
jgi:hypothetical protein